MLKSSFTLSKLLFCARFFDALRVRLVLKKNRFIAKVSVCPNAHQLQGQVIGDGHCVSLIKHCSSAPHTALWRPGIKVKDNALQTGTIIATFEGGVYPSRSGYHAAIYIAQDNSGIWVWDQWQGKPVHRRLIRWNNEHSSKANRGNAYRVVRIYQQ